MAQLALYEYIGLLPGQCGTARLVARPSHLSSAWFIVTNMHPAMDDTPTG